MNIAELEKAPLKAKVETARCTGKCCKDFFHILPPIEFAMIVRLAQRNKRLPKWNYGHTELFQLADLLIFKHSSRQAYHNESRDERKKAAAKLKLRSPIYHHYTCRHFKGSDCGIYPWRPLMCSTFPYGHENEDGSCEFYKGCTRRKEFKV